MVPASGTVPVGTTGLTVSATVLPENTTDKRISWSSSNPQVATVDQTGAIKALSVGVADIIATSLQDERVTGKGTLTVVAAARNGFTV